VRDCVRIGFDIPVMIRSRSARRRLIRETHSPIKSAR
jgi:hypothetical protein